MNYLQLVQALARESGTLAGGTTLASVVGAAGRADKLVNWVADAWTEIQSKRDWNWLRTEFSGSLSISTSRYTAASFNIERFSKWSRDTRFFLPFTLYDPGIGQADEAPIRFLAWEAWRTRYDRGTQEATRPIYYSVSPARELCFGPTPDKAYALRGEYTKGPQTLAANGDVPEMPERFHRLIVWGAMELMAGGDESPGTLQEADRKFKKMWLDLCNDQLPEISTAGNVLA